MGRPEPKTCGEEVSKAFYQTGNEKVELEAVWGVSLGEPY